VSDHVAQIAAALASRDGRRVDPGDVEHVRACVAQAVSAGIDATRARTIARLWLTPQPA
jgi:hypothetical protein